MVAANNFCATFRVKFQSEHQMNHYEEQWKLLTQGRKKIEEYMYNFTRLLAKVDQKNNLPVALIKKKFIYGLNPKITPLIYVTNLITFAATIDTTTRIVIEFEMSGGTAKINQ